MYTIGVTGGIGAGKSQVLDYLQKRWGARVIRLDDISREMLAPGNEVYDRTVSLFGEEILLPDRSVNRKRIAEIIFSREDLREKLDGIIHPAVKKESLRQMALASEDGCRLFVIEAALLIEDHYDAICDELWYIYAGETTRYSRLASSRGYDEGRIRDTMARQLSDREFRLHTDYTIDNDGDFRDTERAIDRRLTELENRVGGF